MYYGAGCTLPTILELLGLVSKTMLRNQAPDAIARQLAGLSEECSGFVISQIF